jgi:hypothetical protein
MRLHHHHLSANYTPHDAHSSTPKRHDTAKPHLFIGVTMSASLWSAGFDLDPLLSSIIYRIRALLRELPKGLEPSSALPWSHCGDKERLWWAHGVSLKENQRVQPCSN